MLNTRHRRRRSSARGPEHRHGERHGERCEIDGIAFDNITEQELVDLVVDRACSGDGGVIVTPNTDILRQLQQPELRDIADNADLVVADGMPVVWASRLQRTPLKERVTGADLLWSLSTAAARRGLAVFLLGAAEGVGSRAAARLTETEPGLRIAGVLAPPRGFIHDPDAIQQIEDEVRASQARIVFIALGFPMQERLAYRLSRALPGVWFIGCGAAIDFASGDVSRAHPRIQKAGMEWAFRLATNPRRLWVRYLRHGVPYTALLLGSSGRRGLVTPALTTPSLARQPAAPARRDVREIAVIIVTYRSERHLDRLFASLPAAMGQLRYRVIAVDNASPDGTVAALREHPDVSIIESGGNYGFAAGINIARAHVAASADAIAILNPDLEAGPGSLAALAEALSDPSVGIAAPRVHNEDGTVFTSLFHRSTLLGAAGEAAFGSRWPTRPERLTEIVHDRRRYDVPQDVEWAAGSAWLMSRDADRAIGDWDESFFLYSEETEAARRVTAAGLRVRYVPEATVVHSLGGSGSSVQLDALLSENRIRLYARHHRPGAARVYRVIVTMSHLARSYQPRHRAIAKILLSRTRRVALPKGDLPRVRAT